MKLKVFTIYDSKLEAYLQPFYMQTRGQAIRALTDTLADPKHQFSKHPSDFTLFELGEYNDNNAEFEMHLAKISLGTCNEFLTQGAHQ